MACKGTARKVAGDHEKACKQNTNETKQARLTGKEKSCPRPDMVKSAPSLENVPLPQYLSVPASN